MSETESKKRKHQDEGKKCPFHSFVVTSPDSIAATAALQGPLKQENLEKHVSLFSKEQTHESKAPEINIISTSDPFDTRMGSGGGTFAAIDAADSQIKCDKGSILIIHAGGQSSRCPTQMTLGKAWTDLPLATGECTNPTYILMESLSNMMSNLPNGSIVISASDVILDLPSGCPINFEQAPHNKVLGLAIPAKLMTAKNHGVFHINGSQCLSDDANMIHIKSADAFYQKPSVEYMRKMEGCTFLHENEEVAWIDTGVVIFLPDAANALRDLVKNDLSIYSESGLRKRMESSGEIYNSEKEAASVLITKKLELYSHLLLAIPTVGAKATTLEEERLKAYLLNEANADFDSEELTLIFQKLSSFELDVCTVPGGSFIHLGTSKEMLDFMVKGSSTETQGVKRGNVVFRLSDHKHSFLNGVKVGKMNVTTYSMIDSTSSPLGDSSIGTNSLVEYCHLEKSTIKVGANCIVSGLRGSCKKIIDLNSNMIIQMLPLRKESEKVPDQYVVLYLGMTDEIKKYGKCYGKPFDELFQETGIESVDIWDARYEKQHMWNAKIHPVIALEGPDDELDWEPFLWIHQYKVAGKDGFPDPAVKNSVKKWKAMQRLSLSQIQGNADASLEFIYRWNTLPKQVKSKVQYTAQNIKDILLNRRHEEVSFDFATQRLFGNARQIKRTEELELGIDVFRDVILSSIRDSNFDVGSRAFMLWSSLCLNIAKMMADRDTPKPEHACRYSVSPKFHRLDVAEIVTFQDYVALIDEIASAIIIAFNDFHRELVEDCAKYLQQAASNLTSKCVISSIPTIEAGKCSLPPVETWIISNAPARIDLSGGWSDTPPISYEFGGAVVCLAVQINRRKPLSARCRRTRTFKGIKLTVESRDINTGDLISSSSVHVKKVQDLSDFRNPRAKCALLKCAILALKLVSVGSSTDTTDMDSILSSLLGESIGLEIISTSMLPQGSGLGTSSILAGCVLSCLGQCVGIDEVKDLPFLIKTVLNLEQLLSTGGGWQDQVGGLYGGLKLCTADKNVIPVHVHVEEHDIPAENISEINKRLLVAYSGKPRLAKNILEKVLRQWAERSPTTMRTVKDLVSGSHKCIDAIQRNDFKDLGRLINEYWAQKKSMAGENSGVEPIEVNKIFSKLIHEGVCEGATLAGAGGGGFLALLLSEGKSLRDAKTVLARDVDIDESTIKWYFCEICSEGLDTFESSGSEEFSLQWHCNKTMRMG